VVGLGTVIGPGTDWRRVPLKWLVDLDRGGRWTSLSTADRSAADRSAADRSAADRSAADRSAADRSAADREWLWTNPDSAIAAERATVRADPADDRGPAFVDAGGGEECWPTVRGEPDHGAAWSRTWSGHRSDATIAVPGVGSLRRRITGSDVVEVAYEITGAPGTGFLHALHLLLDVGPTARLLVPGTPAVRVLGSDRPDRRWPDGLDRLGPDDGTAICALLPGTSSATVVDGRHALRLSWQSSDQPDHTSLLVWRNLRGWPAPNPYRSIGIEPMLGRAADLGTAAADELARIGLGGRTGWTLRIEALLRSDGED
jgi:hypothetical protein